MKKQILFFLTIVLSIHCYSQINFEDGYYINNANEKIDCLIKNIGWRNNPTEFEYKLSENEEPKKLTIELVKEFSINNSSKYIRNIVNIDRSSENINYLSNEKKPIFKQEKLFLKVLVEGDANLYQYIDGNLRRYFYKKHDSNIKQLVFKSYKTKWIKIAENNKFRQQLWNNLKCSNFNVDKVKNLKYKKKELLNFFIDFNECNNKEYVNLEKKKKTDLFNLTVRPRVNNSSLKIENTTSNTRDINFGKKIGFSLGVEAEFILPFNKNKWAIIIEPTYQKFKAENTSNVSDVSGGKLKANIDYNSIEFPVGLRQYFFLKNNSKIFVNASYVFDLNLKSSIELNRSNGSNLSSLELETGGNLAMGIGFKKNNKYSLEVRYQTNRELLGSYLYWSSKYNTLSLIFGYSIF